MKDFISTIRTDRKREIKSYENKGYLVDKKWYRIVDVITFNPQSEVQFGVEANESEIYFFLHEDGANLYFTIEELYVLLSEIAHQEGLFYVANLIEEQINAKERDEVFWYKGVEYKTRRTVCVKDGHVHLNECAIDVSYEAIFKILNYIQEKSNTLFLWSKKESEFVDGTLRLLNSLIQLKNDNRTLRSKGWYYDQVEKRFHLGLNSSSASEIFEEDRKSKYCLTEDEYKNIMKQEGL